MNQTIQGTISALSSENNTVTTMIANQVSNLINATEKGDLTNFLNNTIQALIPNSV